jgi:hypothetical protein
MKMADGTTPIEKARIGAQMTKKRATISISRTEFLSPQVGYLANGLSSHHLYLLTLKGDLFLAPIGPTPQRILDVGTGTGIWVM